MPRIRLCLFEADRPWRKSIQGGVGSTCRLPRGPRDAGHAGRYVWEEEPWVPNPPITLTTSRSRSTLKTLITTAVSDHHRAAETAGRGVYLILKSKQWFLFND